MLESVNITERIQREQLLYKRTESGVGFERKDDEMKSPSKIWSNTAYENRKIMFYIAGVAIV